MSQTNVVPLNVAPRPDSVVAGLVDRFVSTPHGSVPDREVGRLEGQIAAASPESLHDVLRKLEFLHDVLSTRAAAEIEAETVRTCVEYLKTLPGAD